MPKRSDTAPPLSVFAQNLAAVIQREADSRRERFSVNGWSVRHKFTQTTINRIVTGRQDPSTEMIEKIAAAAGLEPWQMFVPGLDPQNAPVMYRADEQRQFLAKLKKVISESEDVLEGGNTAPGRLDELARETPERLVRLGPELSKASEQQEQKKGRK